MIFSIILKLDHLSYIYIGSFVFSSVIDIINYIVFKEEKKIKNIYANKSLVNNISSLKKSIIRSFLEIGFWPNTVYVNTIAILKTLYRVFRSKENLLEWQTAEEAEKTAKTSLQSYYKLMWPNEVLGFIAVIFGIISYLPTLIILGIYWLIAPLFAWLLSKPNIKDLKEKISKEEISYLRDIGEKTWNYFKDNMNETNNFLPPDNYQEDRKEKIAKRTSPTNIGLGMLTVISAYDLKFIKLEETIKYLEKILNTIEKLPKWNGHLYNWYNTVTLELLYPRYISTVDNGNFIGYLYTVKQFLKQVKEDNPQYSNDFKITNMIFIIDEIIRNTDFSILYDSKKRLFSIGFDVEQNKLTNSYYDLLASEARQASLIAIAKKDVNKKHWRNLSRTLTCLDKYKGLVSWSGTAFEYLMPNINIASYEGSLLDESCRFLILSQIKYAKKLNLPWGISEAAFSLKDFNNNYQYKSFGIPWLGLKRGLEDDLVISPYSVFLSLNYMPSEAISNLKKIEQENMVDKYGFYESIDYTMSRLKYGEKYKVVKTYMAHHQALSLISINNFINDNAIVKRFMDNPEIKAIDVLLQEKMPEKAIITKEKKEKIKKEKLKDYQSYIKTEYSKLSQNINRANVISNGKYLIATKQNGEGFSKYEDILINRYKETADYEQGIFFYIKDLLTKNSWTNTISKSQNENVKIEFGADKTLFTKVIDDIELKTKIIVSSEDSVEIRRVELKNNSEQERKIEITSYFEPVLSKPMQDYAHPAFNNLFLNFERKENDVILINRKKRLTNEKNIYLANTFYTENETIGELEFETDKEKIFGKKYEVVPETIRNSKPLSNNLGLVVDPCIAMKRIIKIKPKQKVKFNLVLAVSYSEDEALNLINKYSNNKIIEKSFELARAKVEAENIYLGLKGVDIEKYQMLLAYTIFKNPLKKLYLDKLPKINYFQSNLWKYGVSGDIPIILVKISDLNEMYILKDCLKAYEFFRSKNIIIDLVIINEEKLSYDQYISYEIENQIASRQLDYLKNVSGGIFVLNKNQISKEDVNLFEFVSNFIIEAKEGDIKNLILELEKDYNKKENIGNDEKKEYLCLEEEKLLEFDTKEMEYMNEYGGFLNNGEKYVIVLDKNNKPPTAWSMILANENFGTIVTQNLGGFTWNKNSRLNRLSSWSNNSLMDLPSEIIYFKDMANGKVWTLSDNLNCGENISNIIYEMGKVTFKSINNNILEEVEIFVPTKDKIKINLIHLKNLEPKKRNLKLIYYIKPVLGEDEIKTNGYIILKKEGNLVIAKNLYKENFEKTVTFVSSNQKIKSYTGDKNFFIGTGNLSNPEGINKTRLDNSSGLGENSCIAIELEIELESFETKDIILEFGEEESEILAKDIAYKYSNIQNCMYELNLVKNKWYELLDNVKVETPLESLNIIINYWAKYQTINSRLWGKTGNYQSGGAIGFRDQLQDTLGLKYVDIEFMKKQILIAAKHQFLEGDVEHWWHEETGKGIRTRFSDDLLWLPYIVNEYIEFTGDWSILEEKISYIEGDNLQDEIDERYDLYKESNVKENLYMHCIKAIDKALDFGEHGIPKIGSGDWNDGLNTVGNKKKGESVWLRIFLI